MTVSLSAAAVLAVVNVFVSPRGDDAGDGSRARPFSSFERARDAVREMRRINRGRLPAGGVVVELLDGVWYRDRPLLLDSRDSGDASSPVIWRAAVRGEAVVSGRARMRWRPLGKNEAPLLPPSVRKHVRVGEIPGCVPGFTAAGCSGRNKPRSEVPISLFDARGRLENSRWPNGSVAGCGDFKARLPSDKWREGIIPFPSPRLAAWAREPDPWTHGFWEYRWSDLVSRVKKVDVEGQAFYVEHPFGPHARGRFPRFIFRNAFSELDKPGEWVVDRANRRVYVWTRGGDPEVAYSPGLVVASNLSNVAFTDLVFEKSRMRALSFVNCTNVTLAASLIRDTSSWGAVFSGCGRCRVRGCDVRNVGEGGIGMNGGDQATMTSGGNVVDNCHIGHYGQVVWNYKPGVHLSGVGNRVSRCLIHHARHQGIGFNGSRHLVELNVIHDTCIENDDSGAIYCYHENWTGRGTVIDGNLVHMTGGSSPVHDLVFGIYLDAYSSDITVRNNIVNRAPSGGVFSSGGQGNTLERNVIINCPMSLRRWNLGLQGGKRPFGCAVHGEKSFLFQGLYKYLKTPVADAFLEEFPNVGRMLEVLKVRGGQYAHGPLFYTCRDNALVGSVAPFTQDLAFTADYTSLANNVVTDGDPGFTDYEGMDWSLRPDSPIRRVISGDTRFREMGLYADRDRFSPPVRFGAGVTPPRRIRPEYCLGTVRIDVEIRGDAPDGREKLASGLVGCSLFGGAAAAKRLSASFGESPVGEWKDYSFSFVPEFDCTARIMTLGANAEKTMYTGIRVEGVPFDGDGFASDGWKFSRSGMVMWANGRPPLGVLRSPGSPRGPDGGYVALSTHLSPAFHEIELTRGRRVTVSFKAKHWEGD